MTDPAGPGDAAGAPPEAPASPGGHQNPPDAPNAPPDATDGPETDTGAQPDNTDQGYGDADQAQAEADDEKPDDKIGREAARYRRRLREAQQTVELQNATLADVQDTLSRQRQAIIDSALQQAGLDPRLLAAAGHQLTDFVGDDGLIDTQKLSDAARAAAAEFGVTPRLGVKPNPQQGMPSVNGEEHTSWSTLLGKAAKGRAH